MIISLTVEAKQSTGATVQAIVSNTIVAGATNTFVRPQTGAGVTGGISTQGGVTS